jgi:hypothetical protein
MKKLNSEPLLHHFLLSLGPMSGSSQASLLGSISAWQHLWSSSVSSEELLQLPK